MKNIFLILIISILFIGCSHKFDKEEMVIIKPLKVEGQVLHVRTMQVPMDYNVGYVNSFGEYVENNFQEYQLEKKGE